MPKTGTMFIVFEGLDSSGKETQAKLLEKALKKKGFKVMHIDFPDYKGPIGKLIKRFLEKKADVDDGTLALLYAADRRHHQKHIEKALEEEKVVIVDRYIYSNIAYQGVFPNISVNWLASIESNVIFPDLVFLVDVPVKETMKRKKKKDRYERNKEMLEKVRESYIEMANGTMAPFRKYGDYSEWIIIDGTKSIEDIHKTILKEVLARIPRKDILKEFEE